MKTQEATRDMKHTIEHLRSVEELRKLQTDRVIHSMEYQNFMYELNEDLDE